MMNVKPKVASKKLTDEHVVIVEKSLEKKEAEMLEI